MLPESVNKTLIHVWRSLEPLDFPVALIGGAAMTMWGHARFTKDVDFILAVATQNVSRVVDTLRQHRIVPRRYPPATPLGEVDLVQFDYQLPGSYNPCTPSSQAMIAFCTCMRLAACWIMRLPGLSITSSVTSSPRRAGRQCRKMASAGANFISDAFT